jgi:hypothetical protein
MDADWVNTTKPSMKMREILIVPKPGLGMLAGLLGGMALGGLLFAAGAGTQNPFLIEWHSDSLTLFRV